MASIEFGASANIVIGNIRYQGGCLATSTVHELGSNYHPSTFCCLCGPTTETVSMQFWTKMLLMLDNTYYDMSTVLTRYQQLASVVGGEYTFQVLATNGRQAGYLEDRLS